MKKVFAINRNIFQNNSQKTNILKGLDSKKFRLDDDDNPFYGENSLYTANENFYKRQLDLYILMRNQIEHEDELINQRLTWSLTAQGFLLIAYSALLNLCLETFFGYLFLLIIGLLGIRLCRTTFFAINSAVASLDRINYCDSLYRLHSKLFAINLKLPPISGRDAVQEHKSVNIHIYNIPKAFGIAWAILIIAPIIIYFSSIQNVPNIFLFPFVQQRQVQFVIDQDKLELVKDLGIKLDTHTTYRTIKVFLLEETNDHFLIITSIGSPKLVIEKSFVAGIIYIQP